MADKENTTMAMGGREANVSSVSQPGTAATRAKPAQPSGRGASRTRGGVSMLCIPARDGANPLAHDGAVAKVVITRDPRKPIYVCWEEKDGANLSVAIEAEGKE